MLDDLNPWLLFSGLIISTVGFALFMQGKKAVFVRNIAIGLTLMIAPVLVHSLLVLWLVAAGCVAGAYLLPEGA